MTETANPENEINLLTDVAVCSNNTDDSQILNKRLERIKEKTPDLKELHTDGAYGNEDNDRKMEQLGITHVQTAVRGRKAEVAMEIEEITNGQYVVRCPHQCVTSQKATTRNKASFDVRLCNQCPWSKQCPAKQGRKKRVYYFDRGDYLLSKRSRNIELLPPERRKLRPNVEATVKEFTKPLNHKGKLKVRGGFKTMLYAYSMGISINFGRVYRYIAENPSVLPLLRSIRVFLLGLLGRDIRKELREALWEIKNCRLALSLPHL